MRLIYRCTAGKSYFAVSSSGNVMRCWARPHEKCGSVTAGSFNTWHAGECDNRNCLPERECQHVTIWHYKKMEIGRRVRIVENYNALQTNAVTIQAELSDKQGSAPIESLVAWLEKLKEKKEHVSLDVIGRDPTIYTGLPQLFTLSQTLDGWHCITTAFANFDALALLLDGKCAPWRWRIRCCADVRQETFDSKLFIERARLLSKYNHMSLLVVANTREEVETGRSIVKEFAGVTPDPEHELLVVSQ